jgi:lipoprotein-anchoring transpeptidase ErfK/SrfK
LTSSRRVSRAWLAAALAVIAVLGGVTLSTADHCAGDCAVAGVPTGLLDPHPPPARAVPAALAITPAPNADDVNPADGVRVAATDGVITDVTMVNDGGKAIAGVLAPDRKWWKPTAQLGYGRTYTMTIHSAGATGMPAVRTASFTTVSPDDETAVYLDRAGGDLLEDGATYGIGMVIVAHFDTAIEDKANAERHMVVTTNPPVAGSWYWTDERTAHWRPEKYYTPGTSVNVAANMYGAKLGDGLYGQEDEHVSFKIGDAHVSIADDNTKQVQVFNNGQLLRTMPTSMGMGGTQDIGGRTLSFFTPSGVYTVLDKANPVVMDSSTFGLPIESRLGYKESIAFATRISVDGIYLHQLNSTVWAQGNTDTSHGCLNLNAENAEWFFNFAVPGDIVEVRNTGGEPLALWQNGDWSVPWAQWRAGSKLA